MSPADKLAQSLSALKALQDQQRVGIQSSELTRTHRERLLQQGFLREVMKGWFIPTRPDERQGESTSWYASFWGFCHDYLNTRFGTEWCLGAEQSISLHVGNWTIPRQLLVRSPKAGNKPTALLHGTSLLDLRLEIPAPAYIQTLDGIRVMRLEVALIQCLPRQFSSNPIEMRAALAMLPDASNLLRHLLEGGNSIVAGRLAGAFRNIGRDAIADNLLATLRSAGYSVSEQDPFADRPTLPLQSRSHSPYVNRLRMMWQQYRQPVIEHFNVTPNPVTDATSYLQHVEEVYLTDAYNSLSIEGYRVNTQLIEQVRSGQWNPQTNPADREHLDAMAARGYWQAFQAVKHSVAKVLQGENAGTVARQDLDTWYRELFAPSVTAGILSAINLAGYRNHPVYIRHSQHVPPNHEAVRKLLPALFELMENEPEPAVNVVLSHFFFVYIHPYMDGNGRCGRFLMNLMMAAGGYPWTVVPLAKRDEYMDALEQASVGQNIVPFTRFIAELAANQWK